MNDLDSVIGPQTWYSYECIPCAAIIDIRRDGCAVAQLPSVKCPFCEARLECEATWPSAPGGYNPFSDR